MIKTPPPLGRGAVEQTNQIWQQSKGTREQMLKKPPPLGRGVVEQTNQTYQQTKGTRETSKEVEQQGAHHSRIYGYRARVKK